MTLRCLRARSADRFLHCLKVLRYCGLWNCALHINHKGHEGMHKGHEGFCFHCALCAWLARAVGFVLFVVKEVKTSFYFRSKKNTG
jgi:hypothetical protein